MSNSPVDVSLFSSGNDENKEASENTPQSAWERFLVRVGFPARGLNYVRSPGRAFPYLRLLINARYQLRHCTEVGRWTRVLGKVRIFNGGEIVIGQFVHIISHCSASVFATFPGGRIEIGDRTVLNYGVDIAATKLVRIGRDCMLGTHVIILDNDFHDLVDRDRRPDPKPVTINDRVWIGNRAIVMPGVTIGEGAAVGAGSVVMTDIPPRSLAIGNPARVIKQF